MTLVPALAVALAATTLHAAPAAGPAPARLAEPSDASDEGALVERRGDSRILIYEGDTLEGEVLSPGGATVAGHIGARHASLVGIRPHFVRELVRLSNDL
jgi:hypothetical protein